jgi:hypothetical protein
LLVANILQVTINQNSSRREDIIYTKCLFSDCKKSKECQRFLREDGTAIFFENICREDNGFTWFWKADQELIKKEENNATS